MAYMMSGHQIGVVKKKAQPPLGTGERFAALKSKLANKKGVTNPAALAASIGRKKYGSKKMTELSVRGRKSRFA